MLQTSHQHLKDDNAILNEENIYFNSKIL